MTWDDQNIKCCLKRPKLATLSSSSGKRSTRKYIPAYVKKTVGFVFFTNKIQNVQYQNNILILMIPHFRLFIDLEYDLMKRIETPYCQRDEWFCQNLDIIIASVFYQIIQKIFHWKLKFFREMSYQSRNKEGCVFPIAAVSIPLHGEFGSNKYREDAPHFIFLHSYLWVEDNGELVD